MRFAVTCVLCVATGVYPCCGRTAQRGPSQQRPLPQLGCAYQPHTPLTPPEAPIYNLSSELALSDSVQKTQTMGLVHILMKHQSQIVRSPGDVRQEQAEESRPAEEQEGHQDIRAHEARPAGRDLWALLLSYQLEQCQGLIQGVITAQLIQHAAMLSIGTVLRSNSKNHKKLPEPLLHAQPAANSRLFSLSSLHTLTVPPA